jgi:hypothetical protein
MTNELTIGDKGFIVYHSIYILEVEFIGFDIYCLEPRPPVDCYRTLIDIETPEKLIPAQTIIKCTNGYFFETRLEALRAAEKDILEAMKKNEASLQYLRKQLDEVRMDKLFVDFKIPKIK